MPEIAPESNLSRIELLQLAQSLGVSDADVMTRAELRTAIDKARRPEPLSSDQQPATWVGVARRLLASVVERGLNLPDAASLIRGDTKLNAPPKAPPPVATVTLARIYGAQGHFDRAIATLDEVLESDPDHELARELRNQLAIRRTESLARASNATPAPARGEPESASGAPTSRVAKVEEPNHAQLRPETAHLLDGLEARPFANLDAGAEAPGAEARALAASNDAELEARVQTQGDRAEPTSAQPPPFVDGPASEAPVGEASPATMSLDADAELVAPAFAPAPQSAQPPPFVDASNPSGPTLADGPLSAQQAYVDAPTGSEPPFAEAPLSAQPPAFIDTLTGSGASSGEAPPSVQPPAYVDSAALASAPAFTPPVADAPGNAPRPPAIRLDADAELVAPAFAVIEHGAQAGETPTGRGSLPAFYTEPPARVSALALDREIPPAAVGVASMSEPPSPAVGTPANAAASSAHVGSAPAISAPLPDPSAPLGADTPPSHAPNGVSSNGIQNGAEPLPLAAALAPSPLPPKLPGLVLIETDTPVRYLYWELAASGVGAVHWIHIVTHTPGRRGPSERHERRYPVQRQLGALRLEGVPAHAVVRARLTQQPDDPRALVVAGSVKPRAPGAAPFEVRFSPHIGAKPEALATRAQPLLERASPIYWDC